MSAPPLFPLPAYAPTYSRATPRSGTPNTQYVSNALSDLGIPIRPPAGGADTYSGVPDSRSDTGQPKNVEEWFRGVQAKEFEQQGGTSPIAPYQTGTPQGYSDHMVAGLRLAGEKIGQTAAGLGAMVGVPGSEERRQQYERNAQTLAGYMNRDPNISTNSVTGTPGELLGNVLAFIPELYNPASKMALPAKGANLLSKLAHKVSQYDTPLNTTYHGLMGYAPEQSVKDAAFSGGSHPVGEMIERKLTKGRGIPGQPVGVVLEKGLPQVLDWLSQPSQAPSASYIPVRP